MQRSPLSRNATTRVSRALTAWRDTTETPSPAATASRTASVLPSSIAGVIVTPRRSKNPSATARVLEPGPRAMYGSRLSAAGVTARRRASGWRRGTIATNSSRTHRSATSPALSGAAPTIPSSTPPPAPHSSTSRVSPRPRGNPLFDVARIADAQRVRDRGMRRVEAAENFGQHVGTRRGAGADRDAAAGEARSEEQTSELQSPYVISYA